MVDGLDDLDAVAAEEDRVMDRDLPVAEILPLALALPLQLSLPLSLPARHSSPVPLSMARWVDFESRTGLGFERMLPQ